MFLLFFLTPPLKIFVRNMVDADTTLVICSIFDGHNFIMFVLAWAGEGESVRNWE